MPSTFAWIAVGALTAGIVILLLVYRYAQALARLRQRCAALEAQLQQRQTTTHTDTSLEPDKYTQNVFEERLEVCRLAFDAANDLIFVHPMATEHLSPGCFTQVSNSVCRTLGYTGDELLRLSPLDIIDEADHSDVPAEKTQLLADQELLFNKTLIAKNGDRIPVEIHTRLFEYEGQPMAFSIARNVSRRKQLEDQLRHYQYILIALEDSVSFVDQDYIYRIVNDEYLRRTGKNRDAIVGHSVAEIMGQDAFQSLVKPELDRCLNGETVQYQAWFDFAVKGRRFIDVCYSPYRDQDNRIAGVVVSARDITPLKQAEEAAQLNLAKYKTLFDMFPFGITVADQAGKIVETNWMAEKLLGISQPAQQERTIDGAEWRIVRLDGTPMPAEEYASVRALRENRLVENVEMGIVKARDDITWLSTTAAPLNGHGVIVAYYDISERKRVEEHLRQLATTDLLTGLFNRLPAPGDGK